MSVLGIAVFVLGLVLMILLHEAGHFLTARAFGIKVEEFFVGFGPRLWSTKRGETEYGLKAIPLGGYVRIAGMNPFQETPKKDLARTFGAKPAWQRAIVLAAGSATHFILALLLLLVFFWAIGVPTAFSPRVIHVEPRLDGRPSPAAVAGIEPGDEIVSIDGVATPSVDQFLETTRTSAGEEMTIVVERDDRRITVRAAPVLSEVEGEQVGRLGIVIGSARVLERDRTGPLTAIGRSAQLTGEFTYRSFEGLGQVFSPSGLARIGGLLFGEEEREVTDPTGIVGAARLSGQAASSGNIDSLLLFLAGFNVFVGILNILPLPPLDGGHLAVLAVEKVTGRKVDVRRLLPLTALVAGVLILLTVSLTYLDVVRPLPNPFQ
ncbi:MAG: M50 family metallopeptidase [Actinomycetota bacterium]